MLPIEIEDLIRQYCESIVLGKHPCAEIIESHHALQLFQQRLTQLNSRICPICHLECALPFQMYY